MGEAARTTAILGFSLLLVSCVPSGDATGEPTNEPTVLPSPSPAEAVVSKPPTTRFTSNDEGYTLRYPAGYNVVVYRSTLCLTDAPDVVQACHFANALVAVTFAEGQTLEQAADAVAATTNPTTEVQRSEITLGGERAVQLDNISTYDVFRVIVVLHGDRLYTLSFLPWSPTWEGFERLETLFDTVISTFEFVG